MGCIRMTLPTVLVDEVERRATGRGLSFDAMLTELIAGVLPQFAHDITEQCLKSRGLLAADTEQRDEQP